MGSIHNEYFGVWKRLGQHRPKFSNSQFDSVTAAGPVTVLFCEGTLPGKYFREEIIEDNDYPQLLEKLYLRHKLNLPASINGDCCWIIWDDIEQRLVFSNNRVGSRSIYYYISKSGCCYFSNNIARIQQQSGITVNIDERSILRHFHCAPPADGDTFYKDINRVKAGEMILITNEKIDKHRYWKLTPQPTLKYTSDRLYADHFKELLHDVCSDYIRSGSNAVALSGGLDSTTLATGLKSYDNNLKALSFCFSENSDVDESASVRDVANGLGIDTIWVNADKYWPLSQEYNLTFPHSPLRPMFVEMWDKAFQLAHEDGIQYIYTGNGGDELFGGSPLHLSDLLLTARIDTLFSEINALIKYKDISLKTIIRRLILSPILHAALPNRGTRTLPEIPWLGSRYRNDIKNVIYSKKYLHRKMLPGRNIRYKILTNQFLFSSIEAMNKRAEHFGIELIHPLLDHRLLEFAASLPTTQSFNNATNKYILRNAMKDILPDSIVSRREKTHPANFADRGIREHENKKILNLITDMKAAEMGLVNETQLNLCYQRYLAGETDITRIWMAITFEEWLRNHTN